jgi:AcrR family transcriptional regulator
MTPNSETEPLRERKKTRTRRALEESALRLFREKGFDDTTVEDIAAAVEVSKRTFFRYFPSKIATLFAEDARHVELIADAVARNRPRGEPSSADVRAATETFAVSIEHERSWFLERHRLIADNPSLRQYSVEGYLGWTHAFARALGGQEWPRATLAVRVLSALAMSVLAASLEEWLRPQNEASLVSLVEASFAVVTTPVTSPN